MKLLVCDLDMVVCDNTKRFEKAEEARQAFRADVEKHFGTNNLSSEKDATNLYWQTAFDPGLVELDTLIEGVHDALNALYGEYGVIFITSRPESMRGATEAWLEEHDVSVEHPQFGNFLVMKQPAFQYVKTVMWKAGMVQMLFNLFDASEMIVIDDEVANLEEIGKWIASPQYRGFTSLAEAVEALREEKGQ